MANTTPRPIQRIVLPIQEFMQDQAAGGIILVVASLIAIAWANSPWSHEYTELIHMPLILRFGEFELGGDLHFWINDGLMVFFFFLVGLEIKRELTVGELNSVRRALVPAAAAAGGMAVPALIFVAIATEPADRIGWAVPMATDIAFALGVASLLGPRVPLGLKAFLLALAIFDDIGATIVIALFYGGPLNIVALGTSVGLVLTMVVMARLNVRSIPIYVAVGAVAWLATYESGVHPVLVGVAIGLITPWEAWQPTREFRESAEQTLAQLPGTERDPRRQAELLLQVRDQLEHAIPPLDRLEHGLSNWVAFLIVPIFALANAGVDLRGDALGNALSSPIAWGVTLGLLLGKPIGITIATWLAVKVGAEFPAGVSWLGVISVGFLAGIGFTVAIFVANLAYEDAGRLTGAKVGIFTASIIAGVLGYVLLRLNGLATKPGSRSEH